MSAQKIPYLTPSAYLAIESPEGILSLPALGLEIPLSEIFADLG
jgi:hypothetical protein